MPGLSGAVLLETLRLCRPGLPVVCMTLAERAAAAAPAGDCLPKPFEPAELRAQVEDALAGLREPVTRVSVDAETLARAKSAFAATGSLLDVSRELARGFPGESADGW
jgi:FixJ family two-component response regulator